jgi:hypothetical protein
MKRGRRPDARDGHLADVGAEPPQGLHGRLEGLRHFRLHVVEEVVARHADAQPADAAREPRGIVGHGLAARRGIGRVIACQRLEHEGTVLHGARHGAGMIERPGERQDPRPAHAPIRRLEPDDAAQCRRAPDRSAGVRSEGTHGEAGRQRRARAARRPAGDVLKVPRIARRQEPVPGELDAEGELVGDELAQHDHARLGEPRHARRIVVGNPVGEERRAAGGQDAPRRVEVLVRDGNPGERPGTAGAYGGLGRARAGVRLLSGDRDVAIEGLVEALDAGEMCRRHIHWRQLAPPISPPQLGDAEIAEVSGGHGDSAVRRRRTSAPARESGPRACPSGGWA